MAWQRGRECPALVAGCVDSDFVLGQGNLKKEGEYSTILIAPPATEARLGISKSYAPAQLSPIWRSLASHRNTWSGERHFGSDFENADFFFTLLCQKRKRASSTFTTPKFTPQIEKAGLGNLFL